MVEQKETFLVPEEKQIEWSDAGDILENLLKGTISHGADYTLTPLEWATGYDISKDLLNIPAYEDWKQNYRTGFKEGDFGALRHIDKLSHLTGIVPTLGAYKGLTMLPKGMEIAKRYFPTMKHFSDLAKMNLAYKLKQAKDAGTAVGLPATKVARWLQKSKDWAKVAGQSIGRPIRHPLQKKPPFLTTKRMSKKFDVYPHTSYPERELFKNYRHLGIGVGGTRLGVEGIKSLVHSEEPWVSGARAEEVPSYSNYQDPIMRMARTKKDPGLEVTIPLPHTQ